MKSHIKSNQAFQMSALLLWIGMFILSSCETDYPDKIFDPNYKGAAYPAITSVDPPSYFLSGSGDTCLIYGENFVSGSDSTHVYFGQTKGTIISVSEDLIKVFPPIIDGANLEIKVDAFGSFAWGEYSPYTLERVAIEYGGLTDVDKALALDCDKAENLFVALASGAVIAIDPTQEKTYLTLKGSTTPSAIKIGPDSTLYYSAARYIYKMSVKDYYLGSVIDPNAVTPTMVNTTGIKQKMNDFAIDPYRNFFCVGKNGVMFLKADGTKPFDYAASYTNVTLYGIKIIGNYAYVASKDQIWRHQIQDANGTLSAAEDVYTFAVAGDEILSFAISKTGNLYIGGDTLTTTSQALYKVEPSGGSYAGQPANPIYSTALVPPTGYICWGNDDYIYINRTHSAANLRRIIRVNMREEGPTILWKK